MRTPKTPLWRRLGGWTVRGLVALVLASVAAVVPWRWLPPPATAFMVGARLGVGQPRVDEIRYRWVSWDEVSPHLPIAMVASEDQKFPEHRGFDFESIQQALEDKRRRRGGSTISQQVAKNLYLWPGRNLVRKGLEAYFTVLIETFWPKRRILEVYWNVAELAPGVYGAGAASEHHFGKPASRLTPREAALLAAVLPAPRRMSASKPSAYVQRRASQIEREVRNLGGANYLAGL